MPEKRYWKCLCNSDNLYHVCNVNDKDIYQCNDCKRVIICDNFSQWLSYFIPEKDLLEFGYIFNPELAKIELEKRK